jgi:hypothetical protein
MREEATAMWEYKTAKFSTEYGFFKGTQFDVTTLESDLCDLGRQGWELVSIFDIDMVQGGSKYVIAVLKRKL